jgi:hypothetical protein
MFRQHPYERNGHSPLGRRGNNPYGAKGTFKCGFCRMKKQRVTSRAFGADRQCLILMGESRCEACKRVGHPCGDQAFAAEIRNREAQENLDRGPSAQRENTTPPSMNRVSSQPVSWSPYELQPGMPLPRLSEIVRRLELACPQEDVFQINQRAQRLLERLNPHPQVPSPLSATTPRTPALNPYSFEMLLNPYVPDERERRRKPKEPNSNG